MKIGFIGVGVMGRPLVINLRKAGFDVEIYARHQNKVEDLVSSGVTLRTTIKELVANNDVIITMVGYPKDVEEVYFDEDKIINNAKEGTIVIDMTTSSPTLAKKIYDACLAKKIYSLDAPVTGGDSGAKNATLTIFVGGDETIYEKCLPLFKAIGKNIVYVGTAGMGQHAKLANQIAIAGSVSAMAETIAYAKEKGIDVNKLIPYWSSGSAGSWQMQNMAPRALSGDLEPGFFVKHFIKDMKLAIEESEESGLDLKMLHTVCSMFSEFAEKGNENKGTQAIIKYYDKNDKE
jgi:3-hydroxyisobutyrate dehydrogenase/2-hydroxy-3-oxopropionate reductase